MAKRPERKNGDRDDSALWDCFTADVKPLRDRPAQKPAAPAKAPQPVTRTTPASPPPPPTQRPAPLGHGSSPDLDRRTMERLRRGQLRPEARLDLHGMTRDAAHGALSDFIHRARGRGQRVLLVITGRGRDSHGGGVLRAEVPRWLNAPSLRPLVLGFATAQPKDGGAGAIYVLLRRER